MKCEESTSQNYFLHQFTGTYTNVHKCINLMIWKG